MTRHSTKARAALTIASLAALSVASAGNRNALPSPLTGTWSLVAADILLGDGTRAHDYGEDPKGLLIIDTTGHYSLQIYNSERLRFAAGDRSKGTADEYRSAILGCSTHFGTIVVDAQKHTLTITAEGSSYPNQEGSAQMREYELKGDELSYRIQPRPDGTIPISVWRRVK
jgi:Lipocalin-like domain